MYSYNTVVGSITYEVMTQVVYGGGHRLAWGAVLAWVVFACHNGYGGEWRRLIRTCVLCVYLQPQ